MSLFPHWCSDCGKQFESELYEDDSCPECFGAWKAARDEKLDAESREFERTLKEGFEELLRIQRVLEENQ